MTCIERALALNPRSHRNKAIKGCILCEYGIETGSRPLLIGARAVFEELAPEASDYYAHYNLGNALSGLKDWERARDEYLEALNFNDKVPQIWKNLGTTYFHLRDHAKELECYDRALQLNPQLAQALISKANTIAAVHKNYVQAIELLDQALSADPDVAGRWTHMFWWKAFYLINLRRSPEALAVIETGLAHTPANRHLFDLKASVLSPLWKSDSRYVRDAEAYFRLRLEVDPAEVKSLVELADLAKSQSRESEAYDFLARATRHLSGGDTSTTGDDLRALSSLDDLLAFVGDCESYVSFRRSRPVVLHLELYPDAEHKYGYDLLWPAFGLGFWQSDRFLVRRSRGEDVDIVAFLLEVRAATTRAIALAARRVAERHIDATIDEKASILTTLLLVLPLIGLYEASWIAGYLLAKAQIAEEVLSEGQERFLREHNVSPWQIDQLDNVLRPVNSIWGLLREA